MAADVATRSRCIAGTATFTMKKSRVIMKVPARMTGSASQRRQDAADSVSVRSAVRGCSSVAVMATTMTCGAHRVDYATGNAAAARRPAGSEERVQLAGCTHPRAAAHLARQFRDADVRRRIVDEIEFARTAEQEALDRVAAELGENGELPVGLDALGHDDGAEPLSQVDDSAQHLLRRAELVERDDERA